VAVHPTRFLNRNSPLDMLTLDQLDVIHGRHPTKKVIPPRKPGPPKTREELDGEQDATRLYRTIERATPVPSEVRSIASTPTVGVPGPQPMPPATEPPAKPKARLKPLLVAPTDPDYRGAWTPQPCRDVVELEIEVEGLGIVVYPIECEIVGSHTNQPHMTRVPGSSPRTGRPLQDVFVGWWDDRP
jgi:hypothetical protein